VTAILIGRLEQYLKGVEAAVAAEIRNAHLRKQLGRLAVGVIVSVAWSLSHGGPGPLDWKAIVPIAGSALWTQLRAIWPTIPWDVIAEHLNLPTAPTVLRSSPTGMAQNPPPGTSSEG
jgi:hypothetical protein